MRKFLYYFPGIPGINPQMMRTLGILDRFTSPGGSLIEHAITECQAGPVGTGCIVSAGGGGAEYDPATQTWIEGERFWVGMDKAFRPCAEDLQRELGISGYEEELADGQMWRVPLILVWDAAAACHIPNLPRAMKPGRENGYFVYKPVIRDEHRRIFELAKSLFELFVTSATVPSKKLFADAVELLAVNYRIGIEEAGLLGLLDEGSAVKVIGLSFDLPKIKMQTASLEISGLQPAEPVIEEE